MQLHPFIRLYHFNEQPESNALMTTANTKKIYVAWKLEKKKKTAGFVYLLHFDKFGGPDANNASPSKMHQPKFSLSCVPFHFLVNSTG